MRQQSQTAFLIALGVLCSLFAWSLFASNSSSPALFRIPLGIGVIASVWIYVRWQFPLFYFSQLLKIFPRKAVYYMYRGAVYSRRKQYEQAVHDFDHVLSLDPTNASTYSSRGWVYLNLKAYHRAIQDFDRSLELASPSFSSSYGRGFAHYQLRECSQAIRDLEQAFDCASDRATQGMVYAARGLTYFFQGEYRQALREYHAELAFFPQHFLTLCNCGLAHVFLKEYQLAIDACDHALALSPGLGCAYDNRGRAYLGLDHLQQARADFARAWELDPTHMSHGWHLEWARLCQEPPSHEAAARLEHLVEVGAEQELLVYIEQVCQGVAHWIRGEPGEALLEFDQSIQLQPLQWDAHFWRGLVCVTMGRDAEARTAIQIALSEHDAAHFACAVTLGETRSLRGICPGRSISYLRTFPDSATHPGMS